MLILFAIHPIPFLFLATAILHALFAPKPKATQENTDRSKRSLTFIGHALLLHPIFTSSILWFYLAGLTDLGGFFYVFFILPFNGLLIALGSIYYAKRNILTFETLSPAKILFEWLMLQVVLIIIDMLICAAIPGISGNAGMQLRFDR